VRKLSAVLCALCFLLGSSVAFAGGDEEDQNKKCPNFKVSVAYADNDLLQHPGPAFLPSPWNGDPNVTFIGTPGPNGEFDAGAIKIDNLSTTDSLTVDGVTVDIGPALGINVWTPAQTAPGPSLPQIIPPGGTLILTETGNQFDFDTSEIPTSQCTPDGFIPVVHVTVGTSLQQTNNYLDSTQVLNTGGTDVADCPPGSNEGHQWTVVNLEKNKCACQKGEKDESVEGEENGKEDSPPGQ